MIRIGDWVQRGNARAVVQAWGVIVGIGRVKSASRRQAISSGQPMLCVWMPDCDVTDWWPLAQCAKIAPPPLK